MILLLFTENCTEETRKSKKGKRNILMYVTFSITEVFYRKVDSNRIAFPKQIRIKRKYLNRKMITFVRNHERLSSAPM